MASLSDLDNLRRDICTADNYLDEADPLRDVLTSALHDQKPLFSVREIMEIMLSDTDRVTLNPLNLIPIVWRGLKSQRTDEDTTTTDKDKSSQDAIELLELICQHSSGKESLLALQEPEVLGSFCDELRNFDPHDLTEDDELCTREGLCRRLELLLNCFAKSLSRMTLRKKGAALQSIRRVSKALGRAALLARGVVDKRHGRQLVSKYSNLIKSTLVWAGAIQGTDEEERECLDELSSLFVISISAFGQHIQSKESLEYMERHLPRRYLRTAIDQDSLQGKEVSGTINEARISLRMSPQSLLSRLSNLNRQEASQLDQAQAILILLSHIPETEWRPTPIDLGTLTPAMIPNLQIQNFNDECYYLILSTLVPPHSSTNPTVPAEASVPLVQVLVPVAASHPDPSLRNLTYTLVSLLLKALPPGPRLASLTELVSPGCAFPAMRVAAISLVRDAVLDALATTTSRAERNVLASPQLFAAIGRVLLRFEPPDLFEDTSEEKLKEFLEESEPARLTECLGFYYVVLERDEKNLTGIRDRDGRAETKRVLLDPMRLAVDKWLEQVDHDDHDVIMPLVSLDVALSRVYETLQKIN